jgi:hypothetical protein
LPILIPLYLIIDGFKIQTKQHTSFSNQEPYLKQERDTAVITRFLREKRIVVDESFEKK